MSTKKVPKKPAVKKMAKPKKSSGAFKRIYGF